MYSVQHTQYILDHVLQAIIYLSTIYIDYYLFGSNILFFTITLCAWDNLLTIAFISSTNYNLYMVKIIACTKYIIYVYWISFTIKLFIKLLTFTKIYIAIQQFNDQWSSKFMMKFYLATINKLTIINYKNEIFSSRFGGIEDVLHASLKYLLQC